MGEYICKAILGSFLIFGVVAGLFGVGAFLLWDSHVLLDFWNISFAVFRGCVVASFLLCIIDFAED